MKGTITVVRPHNADYVSIEIEDRNSGIMFLVVDVKLADFAKAVLGLGYVPCEFRLTGASDVGKVRRIKTELVYVPNGDFDTREERAKDAVEQLETDGWQGRVRDVMNPHNISRRDDKGAWYSVSFSRLVEK